MQITATDDPQAIFRQYLEKTFKKTASPMAYSCQAVSTHTYCYNYRPFMCSCLPILLCLALTGGILEQW